MGNYTIALTGGGNTKAHSLAAVGGGTTKNHSIISKGNLFSEIQAIVRAGGAKDFGIGQELMTHYTYEGTVYDMPWVVLDNNRDCFWPDGSRHPGLWIGSKYATIEDVQFDASETEEATEDTAQEGLFYCGKNEYTYTMLELSIGDPIPYGDYEAVYHGIGNHKDIYIYGYDRYLHSAIRQWLNSSGAVGEWWTAQHIGDCPPRQLDRMKGFMAGLDSDFLAVINPVRIKVATSPIGDNGTIDVMYDRFFLQSYEEVYGVPEVRNIEGPYFPYWKQITGLESPANGALGDGNEARQIRKINNPSGYAKAVHLRSTSHRYAASTGYIHEGGFLNYLPAYSSHASLPAAVIS